jgi:site-specific recombinase XerD
MGWDSNPRYPCGHAFKFGVRIERKSNDLVFPYSLLEPHRPEDLRNLTKEFIRKAAALGFAIRLHDLHHTHATLLLKNGADLKTVSERLVHAGCAEAQRCVDWIKSSAEKSN